MFKREILKKLDEWSKSSIRKPLILRGARQVGKTTAVKIFSKNFNSFLSFNLEWIEEKDIFEKGDSFPSIIESLCFFKNITLSELKSGKTLLFIDEIQHSPKAVAMLRYFYEEVPELYVIAAGSILENMLDRKITFPVGRVEFLLMHPLTFEEYLWAMGEKVAAKMLNNIPVPDFAHEKMLSLFHRYTLIGGMPEVVKVYSEHKDLVELNQIYESLITAYLEDVEKYSTSNKLTPIIRHVIQTAFYEVANRIKFGGFGNSNYKAKEIKEAFMVLQKAFLFQVVHPTISTTLPIYPDTKKSPRLHILDTGLVNFYADMQKVLFSSNDLCSVFSGKIVEHIVGQELYALNNSPLHTLNFWVREKSQSNAEVDYVIPMKQRVIPIEVKSGSSGRLRSLHSFIDNTNHGNAIRVYNGKFKEENGTTIRGKKFKLLNIPYYQSSQIEKYVEKYF